MDRVKRVEALSGYRLRVEFTDGVRGEVDLSDRLFGPVFEPLRDRKLFTQVSVDEFGAVCWPNGADLAPDALHARLAASVRASSG
jgi:hypothetical protein